MKKRTLSLIVRSMAAILPLTLGTGVVMAQIDGITVISDFGQTTTDASGLASALVFDKAGNLYGVTDYVTPFGNVYRDGTVFEITKKPDGVWSRKVLYNSFSTDPNWYYPGQFSQVVLDEAGNLYGETRYRGSG
jgi:hypothetical protein